MQHRTALFALHLGALFFGLSGIFGKLALAAPLVIVFGRALFAVGAAAGLYEPEFQVGLSALATMALLVTSLLWSGVRVDLDDLDPARILGGQVLQDRSDGLAWAAPRGPDVDYDRKV